MMICKDTTRFGIQKRNTSQDHLSDVVKRADGMKI